MTRLFALAVACGLLAGCGTGMQGTSLAAIEVGFGDPFTMVQEGGEFLVSPGFQGLMDASPKIRLVEFPANAVVRLSIRMTLIDVDLGGDIVNQAAELNFVEVEPGINEVVAGITVLASPSIALEQRATLIVEAVTVTGEPTSARLEQTVVITDAP